MGQLENLIKKHLRTLSEGEMPQENYMFFGNIEQMKRQCELLMQEDKNQIDGILKQHDWAQDHIAEAKSLLDQVFDFLMNQTKGDDQENNVKIEPQDGINEGVDLEEENVPTNPKLWSRAKAAAKAKYDVYPSAYANGFASKWYKERGGGWKKKSKKK